MWLWIRLPFTGVTLTSSHVVATSWWSRRKYERGRSNDSALSRTQDSSSFLGGRFTMEGSRAATSYWSSPMVAGDHLGGPSAIDASLERLRRRSIATWGSMSARVSGSVEAREKVARGTSSRSSPRVRGVGASVERTSLRRRGGREFAHGFDERRECSFLMTIRAGMSLPSGRGGRSARLAVTSVEPSGR